MIRIKDLYPDLNTNNIQELRNYPALTYIWNHPEIREILEQYNIEYIAGYTRLLTWKLQAFNNSGGMESYKETIDKLKKYISQNTVEYLITNLILTS